MKEPKTAHSSSHENTTCICECCGHIIPLTSARVHLDEDKIPRYYGKDCLSQWKELDNHCAQ